VLPAWPKPKERPSNGGHREGWKYFRALIPLPAPDSVAGEVLGRGAVAHFGGVDLDEERVGTGLRPCGAGKGGGGRLWCGSVVGGAELGELVNSQHRVLLDADM
jgi:hypothetical protein